MGRELRKVPANWIHPVKEDGKFKPLHEEFYGDVIDKWIKEHKLWLKGKHPDQLKDHSLIDEFPFYAMYAGNPPDSEYYQTRKYTEAELTHIQLYETTSEGTPVSPVFKADEFEKLCEYAADHCTTFASYKATKEEWIKMLSDNLVYHQSGNAIFI